MSRKILYEGPGGVVSFDSQQNIIIKECKSLNVKHLRHYMEFQKTTPYVVKVLDILNDNTFTMECLNIVSMATPLLSYHTVADKDFTGFEKWLGPRLINPQFYNQAELQKIMDIKKVPNVLKNFSKQDLFELIKTINNVYSASLEYSKDLPSNYVFHHTDFKLENVAVIDNNNKLEFKLIDPNSWEMLPGFTSMQTYYHSQIHLAFITQAMLRDIF